ncbi:MAG: glycosyltransferase family 4 protein [Clostridiales bacterium]|nr:glycosyltransferase family 4 protein [Clostridiales bacterium]
MISINMLSSAEKVKGQGVASATREQINLVRDGLKDEYMVFENEKRSCDICHCHTVNPQYLLREKAGRDPVSVGSVHFLPETMEDSLHLTKAGQKFFDKYLIYFYRSMDYLVTVNPYFCQKLASYGIAEEKISFIPNFVSRAHFFTVNPRQKIEIRKKWNVPQNRFVVFGAGQMQERKGIHTFAALAQTFPQIDFWWAGGFSFGAVTSGYIKLKKLMDHPPNNLHFPGIIDREKMNEFYNMADIFLLPSYEELFPMTVMEAMTVGMPIVLRNLPYYNGVFSSFALMAQSDKELAVYVKKLAENPHFFAQWKENAIKGRLVYSQEAILSRWRSFYEMAAKKMYSCK